MIELQIQGIIWAQMSRVESLGDGFRGKGDEGSVATLLIAIGIGVAVLVIGWLLLSRFTDIGRSRINSPRKLFAELCTVHELDSSSRRLLKKIAQWQRMKHPAQLFLEPERFEVVNLSPEIRQFESQLAAVKKRIFSLPANEIERAAQAAPGSGPILDRRTTPTT